MKRELKKKKKCDIVAYNNINNMTKENTKYFTKI